MCCDTSMANACSELLWLYSPTNFMSSLIMSLVYGRQHANRTDYLKVRTDGYLLGSYRIATAPEPNSSRLASFKSIRFDSPANNVGPLPASLGPPHKRRRHPPGSRRQKYSCPHPRRRQLLTKLRRSNPPAL